MTVQKSYYPKAGDIAQEWFLVDANNQNLGRLATRIAHALLGKNSPKFTPGVDAGNFVVVVNAKNIRVTGTKLLSKYYHRHSQFPGGLKEISLSQQLEKHPDRVIRRAVWGMLPHNKLGRKLIKQLKIYAGAEHPHQAQQPKALAS